MKFRRKMIVVFIAATLLVSVAELPAIAGQTMAYNQLLKATIPSGRGYWVNCGSVTLNAPDVGFVVVTASGMAWFNGYYSNPTLTLTLAQSGAVQGPWIFTLTPGVRAYQTYEVRMVFPVVGGINTFYLNAESNNGNGAAIGIQTGSLTAEWYAAGDVQLSTGAPEAGAESAAENTNPNKN
jgi:hypothetical protein